MEASEYKDYILGFIFYKYLSDNEHEFLIREGYEDADIVVLNKSSGLLVTADRWDPEALRLDMLATEKICAQEERLYAIHRIDKDTSGLVIYGKTEEAHRTDGSPRPVPLPLETLDECPTDALLWPALSWRHPGARSASVQIQPPLGAL